MSDIIAGRAGTLRMDDGVELYTYRWSSPGALSTPVVLAHGYGEHCGRYDDFARYLVSRGHPTYAFDMRGHGHSPGQRGHIAPYSLYADDLDTVFQSVAREHGDGCVLLGHSHGGLTALLSVERGQIEPAGLILTCPMVGLTPPNRPLPRWAAALLARALPTLALPNGLRLEQLTHDEAIVKAWGDSPLNHGRTTPCWYAGALRAMEQATREIAKVTLPTLILAGELDPIVDTPSVARMAAQLTGPDREFGTVPGSFHEPLNELNRATTYARIGDWIEARF